MRGNLCEGVSEKNLSNIMMTGCPPLSLSLPLSPSLSLLTFLQGRVVFLQVQGMDLKWLDPETGNPISVQPINKIRVWGIGLENDR